MSVNNRWSLTRASVFGCLLFLRAGIAAAQPQIESLVNPGFGVIAITGNSTTSTLKVSAGGRNQEVTGHLAIIENGRPGRYRLTGFPALTTIEVDIDDASLTAGGKGIPAAMQAGFYETGTVITNDQGEAEFQLGATFSTSINNGTYQDAPYKGSAKMRLHFWAPQISDYATVSKTIKLEGEVRTSFAFDEVTPLHFGTLFARASPGDQASITLAPDGRVSIENAGEAKFVSLDVPKPARLQVAGAAPYRMLSIAVAQMDIKLRHVSQPTAPYFILNNLKTSPDTQGRTDKDGQLEIAVGGTLSTQDEDINAVQVYPAGRYEATYTITVSY